MAHFSYKARDAQGRPLRGVIEAASSTAAAEQLAGGGAIPLEISETRAPAPPGTGGIQLGLGPKRPSLPELMLFTRQAFALSKAGVPINRGFSQLAQGTRNPALRRAISEIVDDLDAGRDLAGAMARHPLVFDDLYINMIRVGEQTGRLDEAFWRLFQHLEREVVATNQVRTALRYPMIVIGLIGAAMFLIMWKVIPAFARVYSGFQLELPLPTRIIIGISDFVAEFWWLVILGVIGAIFAFRHFVQTERGRLWWDSVKLRMPVVGSIVLRATLARFARAFSMASRSGVPILDGLRVCARAVGNEFVGRKVNEMRRGVERGESLTRTAAGTEVFTPLVLQMLAVGEETGQVDDMLEEVAEFYEREVDFDVARLNDLIQPVMTIAVGGMVLLLALGVFLPMWDLVQVARQ
jgi:MSHA biogenesis protein MshG